MNPLHATPNAMSRLGSVGAFRLRNEACFDDVTLHSACADGWDASYTQLEPGRYVGSTRDVRFDGMQLFCETNNVAIAEHGTAWTGCYVFGMPLSMSAEPGAFNGAPWTADDVVAMRGSNEFDLRLPTSALMTVAIDCELLQEYAWLVEHVDIRNWLVRGPQVLKLEPCQAASIAGALKSALDASFDEPAIAESPQARSAVIQHGLATVMPIVLQNQELPRHTLSAFGRHQVVKRSREYILEHIDSPIQMIDLCRELRVSRRTLQYSFQDVLGVNPIAYLRVLRLNGARHDLLGAKAAGLQVKDVVARWGFWHLSRFSAEYRQMFHELPSDTLRRGRARV